MVTETQSEMEQHIQKYGEEAVQEADVPRLHPKIIHLLGRLRFRTSYSQNVLRHSIEVAFLAGMMAEEMGLDGALGPPLRPAARHRQGGRSRSRGRPSQDRRRIAQALRRRARSGPRRLGASRRHSRRSSLHGARGRGRRVQRLAPGRPPRIARALHQADGGTRVDRHAASPASTRRLRFRPAASCA